MLLSEVGTMIIAPNEDVLILAERWLTLCREGREGRPLIAALPGIREEYMSHSACPISVNPRFMPLPSLPSVFIIRNCTG